MVGTPPMHRPPVAPAVAIVAEALVLRRAQPALPVLDVLDHVMRGRYGRRIEFGELATPPAPFAYLLAEAFDCMPRSDWEGVWRCNGHNNVRPFLLKVMAEEVRPQFVVRYSLY